MIQGNILITGGAQRVGLALAQGLQAEGYQVWITYRRPRPELEQLQASGIRLIQADFNDMTQVEDCIAQIQQQCDSLRALIHNASSWAADQGDQQDMAIFQQLFQVHMQAPYRLTQALAPLLMQHQGLRDVIHLTDWVIHKGSDKHAMYAATKAGLENLTLSLAKRYAPDIKVNAIAPALICFNDGDDQAYRVKALQKSALQIEPGTQVVLDSVRYLLNNTYLTGASLPLNGGRHLL
ncbi:dihydromonapterin reductase [Balneatrix alpica]|uniref:Dihydromonapterin reductase n=1 Tax=Balneatrix alpica TaxID=75684 RepID=A0ABV5Z6H7_9GAMM|nr:dihydromonapterin reductase [Balneatrix alpica]